MTAGGMGATTGERALSGGRNLAFAILLIIDFVLAMVILFTDKNLQNDFGSVTSGYYSHWYGLLAQAVADLVGALILIALVAMPAMKERLGSSRRGLVFVGVLWSLVVLIADLAIVETYSSVGFPSASEFGKYLFGLSKYPGSESYIPGLYDALIGAYVVTLLVGLLAAMRVRNPALLAPSS